VCIPFCELIHTVTEMCDINYNILYFMFYLLEVATSKQLNILTHIDELVAIVELVQLWETLIIQRVNNLMYTVSACNLVTHILMFSYQPVSFTKRYSHETVPLKTCLNNLRP
jgi:hypothetical protein